ncbi:diguanylate cyclase [Marinobacter sp. M-5]|uniref:diguanylate cyclase n=1 Tax=Marinobacter sp. M-5 TaxID=3081089 RepID=UPI00293CB4CB|nr:diguanylate cyclase [Marinobacter sp. M-5]MDV3502231.1 diguanylate cyclase [Marinobacter sp. M-5]
MSEAHRVDIKEKLGLLKARFEQKALADQQAVCDALRLAATGDGNPEALRLAYQSLHRLAGSAGTFGFRALGDEARALELELKPYVDGDGTGPGNERVTIAELLDDRFMERVRKLSDLLTAEEATAEAPEHSAERHVASSEQLEVLIVEPDEKAGESLAAALRPHGFIVQCVTSFALPSDSVSLNAAVVLVRDRVLIQQSVLPVIGETRAPMICIGSEDTFENRYRLASLGADGYASEPIDVPALVDCMERLISERTESDSGRVMIVDDDQELLEHYSVVLENAGFDVRKVSSPSKVLSALSEFRPDIMLMDMQMGPFSGPVLARMLRFESEWVGLQIIFLSSEEDREFQFNALSQGGDDFLAKPVTDSILVQAAKVRCYRAKQLDKLASRDSLTGLLKHSLANTEVAKEHARCQRLGEQSVVAMLDLDHFKQVNDRHGHRVGDLVIKGLANVLRHHFRQTDVIGRYGGEEFIVALPNCSIEDARQSMQEVCNQLSTITFKGSEAPFSVTLSVGIAPLGGFKTAADAIEAADRALYGRKSGGRNGVTAVGDLDSVLTGVEPE